MIIKVILIIFAYLLIGIAVLELILWHGRKDDGSYKYVDEDDEIYQSLCVMVWPIFIPILFIYLLHIILKHLIKGVRIFFITIVYAIAAIIDMKREE